VLSDEHAVSAFTELPAIHERRQLQVFIVAAREWGLRRWMAIIDSKEGDMRCEMSSILGLLVGQSEILTNYVRNA
jgi:hypothetical protein